jgi:hypothetical protein
MKQRITTFFAGGLLTLALFGIATAGPIEDGYAAYQRGDYATAMRLWRPLADQGNVFAQDFLGAMFSDGHGVAQDYVQAAMWYRKAAEEGNAKAQTTLGLMYANPSLILERRALETQNPPRRAGRGPGKPGNIWVLAVPIFSEISAERKHPGIPPPSSPCSAVA